MWYHEIPDQTIRRLPAYLRGAKHLSQGGVTGGLSFSPRRIAVPRTVKVAMIDSAVDLARRPYYLPGQRGQPGRMSQSRFFGLAGLKSELTGAKCPLQGKKIH